MAYRLFTNLPPQFLDSNGAPLSGGTLTFSLTNTDTTTPVYSDEDGTAASNPLTLDSRGEITTTKNVWGDESVKYRVTLKDSGGSTIWAQDDVLVGMSAGDDAQWITQTHTPTRLTNTTFELAAADGDQTSLYEVGSLLRLTDDSTVVYAEVSARDYNTTSANKTHIALVNVITTDGASHSLTSSLNTVKTSIVPLKNRSINLPFVDLRMLDGFVADGSTDMATLIGYINTYCTTNKKWMYIAKTVESIACASQVAITCNVFGPGTIKTTVKVGNGREGIFKLTASDIHIKEVDFDCNSLSGAVTIGDGADDGAIDGVSSNNAYRSHINKASSASGSEAVSNRWKVLNCNLTNAGQVDTTHGDGMYFAGCHDFEVHSNTIDGYTRIGITFEGYTDADHYSELPHIHHNTILNGVNADDTSVPMSGIWCENTNGSNVHDNTIDGVEASSLLYNSNGIVTGGFRDGVPSIIRPHKTNNNHVNNAYIAYRNPGQGSGNSMTNFKCGIYYSSGFSRGLYRKSMLRDSYFGYSTFDYDGDGAIYGGGSAKYPNCLVLINAGSNADIELDGISIEGITKESSETELADIFMLDDPGSSIVGTTISFDATDNSINDSGAGLSALVEGDTVTITGTSNNNYTAIIKSQSSNSKVILTADTSVTTEAAGASVTLDRPVTLGSLTVKNVKHSEPDNQGIVFRSESAKRCREVRFENCPIDYTLGMMPYVRDLLEFKNCKINRNSPVDITTRCKNIRVLDCNGLPGGRYHSDTSAGSIKLEIKNTSDNSGATQQIFNDATVYMFNNVFDAFAGAVLKTNSSYTTTVITGNNTLINNNGGYLVDIQDTNDSVVFNATTKDDATAIYVDNSAGSPSIDEANTFTI